MSLRAAWPHNGQGNRVIPCLQQPTELFVNRSLSGVNVISGPFMAFSHYEFKIKLKILVIKDHLTNSP